jgi:hypothetical protein
MGYIDGHWLSTVTVISTAFCHFDYGLRSTRVLGEGRGPSVDSEAYEHCRRLHVMGVRFLV